MEVLNKALDDRARAREALCQAQKMGMLGQFTSGIVHDFNNLLVVITNNCYLMLQSMTENDPWRESLEGILNAGERAAKLTRQLLAFSRQEKTQALDCSINKIVSEMEKILAFLIGNNIELSTTLGPTSLSAVHTDPNSTSKSY